MNLILWNWVSHTPCFSLPADVHKIFDLITVFKTPVFRKIVLRREKGGSPEHYVGKGDSEGGRKEKIAYCLGKEKLYFFKGEGKITKLWREKGDLESCSTAPTFPTNSTILDSWKFTSWARHKQLSDIGEIGSSESGLLCAKATRVSLGAICCLRIFKVLQCIWWEIYPNIFGPHGQFAHNLKDKVGWNWPIYSI